jgi:hypothetical protein
MTWITGFAEHIRNTTATIRLDEPREEIKEPDPEPEVEVAVEELEGRELLEYQYNQMRPLVVHEDVVLVPDDEDEDEDDDDEDEDENIFYTASKIVKNIFEFFQFKEKND